MIQSNSQPFSRMKMIHRGPSCQQHLFIPLISLLLLVYGSEVYAMNSNEDHDTINHDHASLFSPGGNNGTLNTNERFNHWKHRRRRRISQNIFLPQQPSKEAAGDVRNKYRIDDSLIDENNEIHKETNIGNGGNGHSNHAMPDVRIINGVSAPETRYPYSVSLQYNRKHICGGSLVSPNIVITAAHCTTTPTKITLGRYDLDSPDDYDYEVLDVMEKIVHPEYDSTVVENDIALLVLERDSVHPYVRLNGDENVPANGEELSVMGWGDVDPSDYGQETSDELRETDVWYLTNSECEESSGYVKSNDGFLFGSYGGSIKPSMLCAHDRIGTTSDACQGDSGGPLVKPGSDSSADVLVGLVSWGFGCADPNFPGVYSRLSSYYQDFLKPTICEHSRSPPSYLNCNPGSGNTGPIPTPSPAPEGLLTIFINTDPISPEDLGWELTSVPDGELIASRPMGYYASKYRVAMQEEVIVAPDNFYRLTIHDRDRDGFRGDVTVVRGRRYVKSNALVYEPGFSSVSGGSVVHGFYVGDNPPRVLTLDLTFDKNPESLAWSVSNVNDDLSLGFKWFDWYGKDFITARETIPVYGDDRGSQQYVFSVLDLDGDGMCCLQGQGSFYLYLGDAGSGSLIATGGQFTTDQSFAFEINSAGLVTSLASPIVNPSQRPTRYPTRKPIALPGTVAQLEYYMAPATGICQLNDQYKPVWIAQVFTDYDQCCGFSWNKQQCLVAKPIEAYDPPSADDIPTNEPTTVSPVHILSPVHNDGSTSTFNPVTGSFTCKAAGMACIIKCSSCGTIKRVASGMTMESPNKSTIIYTAERGTDDWPDNPSALILVESDSSAVNVISCDEGCTCNSVNDNVLGCGFEAKPTSVQFVPIDPSPAQPFETLNRSARMDSSLFLIPCMILGWTMLR